VTIPYGIRIAVRTKPFPKMVRCITSASAMPRTNSIATDTTVIPSVTAKAVHQYLSVSTVM
jgi:hypothetical protein